MRGHLFAAWTVPSAGSGNRRTPPQRVRKCDANEPMPDAPPARFVAPALAWDIFCRVIDNFGDAGVCWRLARMLADEHACGVRLFIDDPARLAALVPELVAGRAAQTIDGVQVAHWNEADQATPGQVVIDAFGASPPAPFLARMAASAAMPVWINLEYLSAEPWVASCHGLPSPHPSLPLTRWFFFPGFTGATGGLLRERGLLDHHAFAHRTRAAAWPGLPAPPPGALIALLFGYECPALPSLLQAWCDGPRPVWAGIFPGPLRAALPPWAENLQQPVERGALQLTPLPFVPQAAFDRLLWAADFNLVRGEDSFVRAQWAGQPLLWHIYPQEDGAHLPKLDAFLDRYCSGLEPSAATALRALHHDWNCGRKVAARWAELVPHWPALQEHAQAWRATLARGPELAASLVKFVESKLKY